MWLNLRLSIEDVGDDSDDDDDDDDDDEEVGEAVTMEVGVRRFGDFCDPSFSFSGSQIELKTCEKRGANRLKNTVQPFSLFLKSYCEL